MAQNPYQTLGINPGATLADARTAYLKRVRVLHPDRFDPVSQKTEWELANQMLQDLNEAWHTIKNGKDSYPKVVPRPAPSTPRTAKPTAQKTRKTNTQKFNFPEDEVPKPPPIPRARPRPPSPPPRPKIVPQKTTAQRAPTPPGRIVALFCGLLVAVAICVLLASANQSSPSPVAIGSTAPVAVTPQATTSTFSPEDALKKDLEATVKKSEADFTANLPRNTFQIPPPISRTANLTATPAVNSGGTLAGSESAVHQPESQPSQAPVQSQSEAQAYMIELAEFNRLEDASKVRALELYPDTAVADSPLVVEMIRLDKLLKDTNNPLSRSPDYPLKLSQMAAKNLGIAPRESPTAPPQTTIQSPPTPAHSYTDSSGNMYSVSDADYQRLFPIKSALDVESQNLDRLEAQEASAGNRIKQDRENLDNTDSAAVDNFNAEVDTYNSSQAYVQKETDSFNGRADDFNQELHRVGTLVKTESSTAVSPTQ